MASDGDSLFDGMDFVTSVDAEADLKSAETVPHYALSASTEADEEHDNTPVSTAALRISPAAETENETAESRLDHKKDGLLDADITSLTPSDSDGALGTNATSFGVQSGPLDENLFSDLSVEQEETANDCSNGVELAPPDHAHTHATESMLISEVVSAGPDSEGGKVGEGAGAPSIPRVLSSESSDSRVTADVDRAVALPATGAAAGAGTGGLIAKQPAPRKKKRSIRVGYGRDEEEEAGPFRPAKEVGAVGGRVDLAGLYASNPAVKGGTNDSVDPMDLMTEQENSTSDATSVACTAAPPSQEFSGESEEKFDRATVMEAVKGIEIEKEAGEDEEIERSEGAAAVGDTFDEGRSTGREVEDEVQEGGDGRDGGEDVEGNGEGNGEENDEVREEDIDSLPLMERVVAVRERIESEVRSLHKLVSALSAERKLAVQNRRAANLKSLEVSKKVKDLEAELAEACEKEEFERADVVSSAIEEAEIRAESMSKEAREAEEECERAAGGLEGAEAKEVEVSEVGAKQLLVVHEAAAAEAQRVKSEAGKCAAEELERLSAEEEEVEAGKRKVNLEQRVLDEEAAEMAKKINESTGAEQQEREALVSQREVLEGEVEELRGRVRVIEAAMAVQDEKIAEVDHKIGTVAAKYNKIGSNLDKERARVAETAEELAAEAKRIEEAKEAVNGVVQAAESRVEVLEEIGRAAKAEAEALAARAEGKKALAAAAAAERAKREELAGKEKEAVEDANRVKSQLATLKTALQEVGVVRTKLQQEATAALQRVVFAEKRGPELEAEKRAAAGSRNFKEAAKLAAEMKMLANDKEAAASEIAGVTAELTRVEAEEEKELRKVAESENAVSVSDKAAAMARCERLRLAAKAARKEMDVAAEAEEFEEAESLKLEAESADEEADALQQVHGLAGEEFDKREQVEDSKASAD